MTAKATPLQATPAAPTLRRLIRIKEVMEQSGLRRTGLLTLMKQGKFPAAIPLNGRAVCWSAAAVTAWVDAKIEASAA
jgi:prophage regulatory protein